MDLQTGLVGVGVVVFSAVVILLVYMVGIKEKSYEEAIAEQRKLPDDLLLSKKEKNKDKKHKNKAGKKVKEKKDEKEEKEEKPDHIQFEETPQILPPELGSSGQEVNKGPKKKGKVDKIKPILVNKDEPSVIVSEVNSSHPISAEANHFDLIHPKDDLELIRSHSRENLQQLGQPQPEAAGGNKSPKDTPTKSKKNIKEVTKRKEDNAKEDKKDSNSNTNSATQSPVMNKDSNQKETKDQQPHKETPVKEPKDTVKEVAGLGQSSTKESKKTKKKNDILAQIGGDKDGVNVSLLTLFIQKAELSRSEIQILIDQLLNKQLDNPLEHSEWTEGRADPMIKLKKQLAEKEKALIDEHEASQAFQAKLKELRAELNNERSRCRQLEEALNAKVTETQTLHTRMQHILESHAAEKQGFARQIEQLQSKVNEDATIIHKMQEDQGQTQGHLQQELIAQRKQMEVQFAQMRENENALKAQLTQKHVEVQELQNELQATCESSTAEIEMLRQQLAMMQGQLMHSEGQLQHLKEAGDHLQDMTRQLDESRRHHADLDHRLKAAHRHDQELQKQINSLKAELNIAKSEAGESSALKAELIKLKSELSASKNEVGEITSLKNALKNKEDDFQKCQDDLGNVYSELNVSTGEIKKLESKLEIVEKELEAVKIDFKKAMDALAQSQDQIHKYKTESQRLQEELKTYNDNLAELKTLKLELGRLQSSDETSGNTQLQIARLEEEKDRLSAQLSNVSDMQKEIKELKEEKESLMNQMAGLKEGLKNGIEDTVQKSNSLFMEQSNLLAQKETQLDALKTELSHKEAELLQLNAQFAALQSDVNQQHNLAQSLRDDLDVQKSKNNELRVKNWKVMEALTAAQSKTNNGKSNNDLTEKLRVEQEESTKAFLQRIFPDIKVSAKSYEQWTSAFETKACSILTELKNQSKNMKDEDLGKQNEKLQVMITHYKNIVHDTQSMLKKLESNVELEETRWQAQLHQKENEVASLRIELDDLRKKLSTHEKNEIRVGSCSVSEQSMLNGPPSSESPKSEGGSGKK